jgi:hypothetical protein
MPQKFVALAIRAAGNLACRRPFRPPFPIRDEFLRLRCPMPAKHEAGEMPANWVSGLYGGGLKGRLQARLPATRKGQIRGRYALAQ